MDKGDPSIDNIIVNITASKNDITKCHEYGIRDFNNVETADRKLIVNKKYEFWVHDDALTAYSEYFADIFGRSLLTNISNIDQSYAHNDEEYRKTEVKLPHENLFFDVLLWIYTRDTKKLKKAAKTFHPFLYLISLGIFLKMKQEFFEILLNKPCFEWKIEYFNDPIWSKTIFTFPILERIVEQMTTNNFTKIIGNNLNNDSFTFLA
jgi:hypothetical protein